MGNREKITSTVQLYINYHEHTIRGGQVKLCEGRFFFCSPILFINGCIFGYVLTMNMM